MLLLLLLLPLLLLLACLHVGGDVDPSHLLARVCVGGGLDPSLFFGRVCVCVCVCFWLRFFFFSHPPAGGDQWPSDFLPQSAPSSPSSAKTRHPPVSRTTRETKDGETRAARRSGAINGRRRARQQQQQQQQQQAGSIGLGVGHLPVLGPAGTVAQQPPQTGGFAQANLLAASVHQVQSLNLIEIQLIPR